MAPDAPDVRLFLFGTPFGIACHQRGLVPLHASTVEVDGEAVAFTGASGVGKSTLAAAFQRRGHRLLGDDVAPVQVNGEQALILPGIRRVRLWEDSAQAAGWDVAALEPCRVGMSKFSHAPENSFAEAPLRARAIVHLERQPRSVGEASFRRLRGRQAVRRASDEIFRLRSLRALAGDAEALVRSARLAGAIPQHFVLTRPHRFEDLDTHVDMILETIRRDG
ncbi:MAG: hypothetical protein J7495_05510 [Sphingomonas sp.]|nr:hypothetical protein [Sphingomonas sp.]